MYAVLIVIILIIIVIIITIVIIIISIIIIGRRGPSARCARQSTPATGAVNWLRRNNGPEYC